MDSHASSRYVPDFGVLVEVYGKAMHRIGQLEAQVESLTNRLQGDTEQEHSRNGHNVVERPDANATSDELHVQNPVVTVDRVSPSNARAEDAHEGWLDDELRQTKLEMQQMASRLAQTTDDLNRLKWRLRQGSRRQHRVRPWWQRLLRSRYDDSMERRD